MSMDTRGRRREVIIPGQEREKHACKFCRQRKIKCDRSKPICRTCQLQSQECVYSHAPKPRPSSAIIKAIQKEKRDVEQLLLRLKSVTAEERDSLLNAIDTTNVEGQIQPIIPQDKTFASPVNQTVGFSAKTSPSHIEHDETGELDQFSSDDEVNTAPFVSIDDQGQVGIFGPTSALHDDTRPSQHNHGFSQGGSSELIANATLQRQREYELQFHTDFDGIPTDLALHLLDLHWNRQHHTFLLTYRPTFTRDLMSDGPYYSKFLLNAIFATASKYSDRRSVRDDPSDPRTAGGRFFRRCDELLDAKSGMEKSSIPTIVGLLLLGSTYIGRGEISKGWIHTGLATRMVYDLGLHLDIRNPDVKAEDVEIRRRVYWGAFICDKLQSLYMGRPISMHMRDSNVSLKFMDTMEELELWSPYIDPQYQTSPQPYAPRPIHSVSTFRQFCLLAKLMSRVLNRFYYVGARASNAQASLQSLDEGLLSWNENLPNYLICQPWSMDSAIASRVVTPNVMLLHTTYHSLLILLHRPFISDGHLRSVSEPGASWKRCSEAAFGITSIIERWNKTYTMRRAPYLLGYAAYVACTIHVRNAALPNGVQSWAMLMATLSILDELAVAIPGISGVTKIIRNLMHVNGVSGNSGSFPGASDSASSLLDIDAIARMFPSSPYYQPTRPQSPSAHVELNAGAFGIPNFDPSLADSGWNDLLTGFWIPHAAGFDTMNSS
ncbi:nitrogen assimilation transcription factor nirA [Xylogone sp. PMI_703]|nr:nitrogen assimilation transcription factor nirA [Xylogone sp. PMI_703]